MQGGLPKAGVPSPLGPGVLEVRRSECQGEPTPQVGLFQEACYPATRVATKSPTSVVV
jgi:hypothetical protein